ncbi:hypothetical protein D3C80_471200 [compost metagenome]
MGNVSIECQAVTCFQVIELVPVAVDHLALQQVKELSAWVGEGRKFLASVIHAHHVRLEAFLGPTGVVQQVVGMAFFRATANDFQPFIAFDQNRAAALLVILAEQF